MHSAPLTQRLIQSLPPRAPVLDLGCGTGSQALALVGAGLFVAGLDADLDAVETARSLRGEEEGSACFLAGLARALPFGDASFAAVLCLDVLHWSEDEAAFAAAWDEAWRVLRPGGVLAGRARALEASPAAAAEDGRPRASARSPWFPVPRATLAASALSGGGAWIEPPVLDGDSWRFMLRKP